MRAQLVQQPHQWACCSYRATAGALEAPVWLTTDWVLEQFGSRRGAARQRYRAFVAEGLGAASPWGQLQRQAYLGSAAFVAAHQPNRLIREVPRQQTQSQRPTLAVLFGRGRNRPRAIPAAYRRDGYRLAEIATHLGAHYATISRALKRVEGKV